MSPVDFKKCQCRMSLSVFKALSPVDFKKWPCHMSLYFLKPCRMSLGPMSHVKFKKQPCRYVDFRGQGHNNDYLHKTSQQTRDWHCCGCPKNESDFSQITMK